MGISHATIFVSLLGGMARNEDGSPIQESTAAEQKMKDCLTGLQAASGFIRRHLGSVLTIRHIPTLTFKEDRGFENATRVYELLKVLDQEKKPAGE